MPTSFHRHVTQNALAMAILNAAMNASYTAYLWWGHTPLSLFDESRVALDLVNTPMVIALLSTLFGTTGARDRLWDGRVSMAGAEAPQLLRWLPNGVVLRSVALAALAGVLLAWPMWLAIGMSGVTTVPLVMAVGLKVLITIVMTLAIVPVVMLAALSDVQGLSARRFAT